MQDNKLKIAEQTLDMTKGNILSTLVVFSLPVLIGQVFQQFYNIADTAIIGNFLGEVSVAAVGATSAIYSMLVGFAVGVSNGFGVFIARYFGAGDEEKLRKTVHMSLWLGLGIALILTLISMAGLKPLLVWVNTPPEILPESLSYLRVIAMGTIVTMLYNLLAAMLRSLGNSRMPLYFLIVSTVINIVLDIVFIRVFSLGVVGTAYATVFSQAVSVVLCILYIWKKVPLLYICKKYFVRDLRMCKDLLSLSLSMAFMLVITKFGNVVFQWYVNEMGIQTITGHTAARKIHEMLTLTIDAISVAVATFISQNFGAREYDRIKKGIRISIFIGWGWGILATIIVFVFGIPLSKFLTGTQSKEVLDIAMLYLVTNVPCYFMLTLLLIYRNAMQSLGYKILPIIVSGIELAGKILPLGVLTGWWGYLGVCVLEPVLWTICSAVLIIGYMYAKRKWN